MSAEIPFEYLYSALETTRGTAITPPTRNLGVMATMTPTQEWYQPDDARGTLFGQYREALVYEASETEAEGTVDLNSFQHYLAGAVKGGVAPTTPEAGVSLWTFTPNGLADDLKSYTLYWGDPGAKVWQAPYSMIDELSITANGSGTDAVQFACKWTGQKMVAQGSAPTAIAIGAQLSLPPARMDYWMDTSTIGTTSITSRILDVEITIPTEVRYKRGPVGAAGSGGLTFRRVGRDKRRATMKITMEVLDDAQVALFLAGTPQLHRVRMNTDALIGATQRGYFQFDTYGYLKELEWGELEGVNRTVSFTVESLYHSSLSADFVASVQNNNATA